MSIHIQSDETRYVLMPVPVERVPEIGRLLYGDDLPAVDEEPQIDEPTFADEQELADLIQRIYLESEPKFRNIMIQVADRPDPEEPRWYTEITTTIGWPTPRSLPGALGAYGRRAKHRYGGFWPVKRHEDPVTREMYLNTDAATAKAILAAHERFNLPTEEA